MRNKLLSGLTLLLLAACTKQAVEPEAPEYADTADWYVVKAPENRAIEAVAGDIDGTLIIATRFKIYQSKDAGKTWQQANYAANLGLFGFGTAQDTLLALTTGAGVGLPDKKEYAVHPSFASLDQGATWVPYQDHRYGPTELRICRNVVVTPAGTEYRIDYELTPTGPNSSSNYVETVGLLASAGRRLTLPQSHQITSLYVDAKSRLYVTASGALCGRRDQFAYCGTSNGVLYVSKKPQP